MICIAFPLTSLYMISTLACNGLIGNTIFCWLLLSQNNLWINSSISVFMIFFMFHSCSEKIYKLNIQKQLQNLLDDVGKHFKLQTIKWYGFGGVLRPVFTKYFVRHCFFACAWPAALSKLFISREIFHLNVSWKRR